MTRSKLFLVGSVVLFSVFLSSCATLDSEVDKTDSVSQNFVSELLDQEGEEYLPRTTSINLPDYGVRLNESIVKGESPKSINLTLRTALNGNNVEMFAAQGARTLEINDAILEEIGFDDKKTRDLRALNSDSLVFSQTGPIREAVDHLSDGDSNLMRTHVLSVGAGSCKIVECPGSDDFLVVDCGSGRSLRHDDELLDYVENYLSDWGIEGDGIVTISHPHEDHFNLVPVLMGNRIPRSIWVGMSISDYGGKERAGGRIKPIEGWIDDLLVRGIPIVDDRILGVGDSNGGFPVEELACGDADTYILTVNVSADRSKNRQSMMLLVQYGNFGIIFPGDAEGKTEDSAMENFPHIIQDISVLVSSHHGASSHSSNDWDWAEKTRPKAVVFSSGLKYEHPRHIAGRRYLDYVFSDVAEHEMWWNPYIDGNSDTFLTNKAIYTTAISGTIVVESDGEFFWLACERGFPGNSCW